MRKLRLLMLAGTFAVMAGSGVAQAQSTGAPSPATLEAARQFVDMQIAGITGDIVANLSATSWPPIEEALRNRYPRIDTETMAELRASFEATYATYMQDVTKELPALYARHFTVDELNELIAFYRSQLGAKFLLVMPRATAEFFAREVPRMQFTQQQVSRAFEQLLRQRGYAL